MPPAPIIPRPRTTRGMHTPSWRMCHAWQHLARPGPDACHAWHARRTLRPLPGKRATRGMLARRSGPMPRVADATRPYHPSRSYHAWHAHADLAHVPRVAASCTPWPRCLTKVPHVACSPHAPPLAWQMCHAWHDRRTLRPPCLAHVPRVASSNGWPFPNQVNGGGAGPQQAGFLTGEPLTGDMTAKQVQQLAVLVAQRMDELDTQTFQGLRPVGEDLNFGHDFGGTVRTLQPNFDGLVFDVTEQHTTAKAIADNAVAALNAARTREANALAAAAAAAAADAAAAGAEAAQAEQGGPQARLNPPSPPRLTYTPHAPPLTWLTCHAWHHAARSAPSEARATRGCTPRVA